ncbi:MAG: response regulator [Bacteroidota bacterium]|jgi:CheY-like chemotaxis protein|nr:response regulator [Bacteroidota bacterium]
METQVSVFENIWLADDDSDDCELFQDVLKQILPSATITIIPDGDQLMKLLTTNNKPDILFLDINMPGIDGLNCLVNIRSERHFSKLPIVIFSSSTQPKHVDASYGYGANLFYSKPSSLNNLIAGLGNIFKMNWHDPYTITSEHYINNKFVAYQTKAEDKSF